MRIYDDSKYYYDSTEDITTCAKCHRYTHGCDITADDGRSFCSLCWPDLYICDSCGCYWYAGEDEEHSFKCQDPHVYLLEEKGLA